MHHNSVNLIGEFLFAVASFLTSFVAAEFLTGDSPMMKTGHSVVFRSSFIPTKAAVYQNESFFPGFEAKNSPQFHSHFLHNVISWEKVYMGPSVPHGDVIT